MMPALKTHHTATSEEAWDGPGNKTRLKTDGTKAYYSKAFAWVDADKDEKTKDAYRFIHHEVSEDGIVGAANIKACQSAIGVLNGARGGTTIPEDDKSGVHKHLAAHLEDADVDVPALKERVIPMQKKEQYFPLEIKEVGAEGSFEGLLSAYDIVDTVGDVVERGAYTKTLKDSGGQVPLLWYHDQKEPLGMLEIEDQSAGLWVKGTFVMDVPKARDVYALLKAGVVKGLSIGYSAVKADFKGGNRHLKELKLFEGSLCLFPVLPVAQVASVKAEEKVQDFNVIFERIRLITAREQMIWALEESLGQIVWDWDNELDTEQKISMSDEVIQQFHAAYIELLPKLFEANQKAGTAETSIKENLSGHPITEKTRAQIKGAILHLGAFLGEEAVVTTPDGAGSTPQGAVTTPEGAGDTSEPKKQAQLEALKAIRDKLNNVN